MWRRAALTARRSLSTAPPAAAARQQKASAKVEPPSRAQLWRLALANGVPFVGFGFADNVIMILAGDAIDKSIGVTLGISTLAAAGFGNLLSDVVGIGAGDVIDRYSEKIIGKPKTKALSLEQLALRSCRIVKTWATIIGITVGCLLGMAPLLFLGEKKELYFTKEEMALYESALRPYGVSPDNFFAMICVEIKVQAPFNSGSLAVGVRCFCLYSVECIRGTSCPSLGRNQGRGAEIARLTG